VPRVDTTTSCRFRIAFSLVLALPAIAALDAQSRTHAAPSIFPLTVRWSVDLDGPPVAGASPLSDDRHVYLALRSKQITAHDLGDGRERWRVPLVVTQPLEADSGLIFAATGSAIHALHAQDGTPAWQAPIVVTAPLRVHAGWLIALSGGEAIALREADGTRVWQHTVGAAVGRPAIEGDRLFISLSDGRVVALEMPTGAQIWERRLGGAPQAPLAAGNRVYMGASDRKFYCLAAATGETRFQWRVGAAPQGSATADDSLVFVASLDNVLRAYDRRSGNQRWQHALKRRPATGPVAVGSYVLVPSSSSAEIWSWTTTGKPASTIATPAEPAVPPEFVNRGADGAFVFLVTGGLANQWKLTLLGTAGDPPLAPLNALPGQSIDLIR
jgi:outer membrane protein assembly factor BamB